MDPLSLAASVIAFIQMADRVIDLCKFYIETVKDAPHDLRVILIDITSLKGILENLNYLRGVDPNFASSTALNLWSKGGTVDECKESLSQLEKLLSDQSMLKDGGKKIKKKNNKRQKVSQAVASLAWPLKKDKASRLLGEISRHKATITLALSTESSHDIREVKAAVKVVQTSQAEPDCRKFCEWLEVTNPSELHIKASSLHQEDTGNWMTGSQGWKSWNTKDIRCLWIHGIPGAGKTVLASFLIDKLSAAVGLSETSAVVYYYCYFGHEQDEAVPMLGWVVSQLCRQACRIPHDLLSLYEKGHRPNAKQLLDGLADILDSFTTVYLLIDALDESKEPRNVILQVLSQFVKEVRFSKIQLLVTSREYYDIQSIMSVISLSVAMQVNEVEADIRKYVRATLNGNRRFSSWPEELRRDIQDRLAIGAKGMFRWAVCQMDVLRRLSTVQEVTSELSMLPETLEGTYERIFGMISTQERPVVCKTLTLLCGHAQNCGDSKPMAASILLSMVAGNWSRDTDSKSMCTVNLLEEACGCLITITNTQASLAHFTVHEFLFSKQLLNNVDARIRPFALSESFINRYYLYTVLNGAKAYTGPLAEIPDSLLDLYDYVVFFGTFAIQRHFSMLGEWKLDAITLQLLAPHSRYRQRLRQVSNLNVHQTADRLFQRLKSSMEDFPRIADEQE